MCQIWEGVSHRCNHSRRFRNRLHSCWVDDTIGVSGLCGGKLAYHDGSVMMGIVRSAILSSCLLHSDIEWSGVDRREQRGGGVVSQPANSVW